MKQMKRTALTGLVATGAIMTTQTALADESKTDISVTGLNSKLEELTKQAEKIGLKVTVDAEKLYKTDSDASVDGQIQVQTLTTAIQQVERVQKQLKVITEQLSKNNIVYTGETTLQLDPTNPELVSKQLSDLDSKTKSMIEGKAKALQTLKDASAKAQGVLVSFKGEKKISHNELDAFIKDALAKISTSEKTYQTKVDAYNQALKDWEKTVADGKAAVEKEYSDAMKAWEATVAEGRAKVQSENDDALKTWEKTVSDGRAAVEKEYQDAVSNWERDVAADKAKIETEYSEAMKVWEKTVADGKAKIEQEYSEAMKAWEETVAKGKQQIDASNASELKAWEETVAAGKAKVEKEFSDAIAAWNKTVADGKAKVEKEYSDAIKAWEETVKAGKAKVEKEYSDAMAAWNKTVADGKAKVEKEYSDAMAAWNKTVADGKAKVEKEYSDAMAVWNKTVADGKAKVEKEYSDAMAAWNKTVADGKTANDATYNKALAAFQKTVDDANAQNARIKAENDKITADNSKAKATLTPTSTARANGDNYTQSLTGLSKPQTTTNTSTSTEHEPMDLIQIIDLSGSLSDGEFSQRNGVKGARKQQINDMIYTIRTKLTDKDRVMLAFYGTNTTNSYTQDGPDGAVATNLMSKQQAIDILTRINNDGQVHQMAQSWTLIPNVIKPYLAGHISNAPKGTGFEDIYKSQQNKNKVVSVLQFTDDWVDKEDIDSSFAKWATENAKTFMTVVDNVQSPDSFSTQKMRAAGHTNIKVFNSLNTPNRQETIASLFESTATVTKVTSTTTNQKGTITITADAGVQLLSAELVSPKGTKTPLQVSGNKATYTGELKEAGNYTVNYTFKSTGNKNGGVKGTFSIDGKETSKTDTFTPSALGQPKPLVPVPTNRPVKGEYKEPPKPVKGEYKEPPKPVKGEYKEPPKPVKGEYKEPPKPVKGEYKEPPKPVKGEYKEPPKPVKGEYKEPPKPEPKVYTKPEKPVKGEYKEPPKPVKGEYKEPPKPEPKVYTEPPKPVKGEYKEPPKPTQPKPETLELPNPNITTEKTVVKFTDLKEHKVAVEPKQLPKTGDQSAMAATLAGVGSLVASAMTKLFGKKRED